MVNHAPPIHFNTFFAMSQFSGMLSLILPQPYRLNGKFPQLKRAQENCRKNDLPGLAELMSLKL